MSVAPGPTMVEMKYQPSPTVTSKDEESKYVDSPPIHIQRQTTMQVESIHHNSSFVSAHESSPYNLPADVTLTEKHTGMSRPGFEFIMYCFFLIFFTLATWTARGDEHAFYIQDRLSQETVGHRFEYPPGVPRSFWEIATLTDVYEWSEQILLPFLFSPNVDPNSLNDSYYTNPQLRQQLPYIALENFVLGGVRIRQIRVMPNTGCTIPSAYKGVITSCYSDYTGDAESTTSYGPNGKWKWYSDTQLGEIGYYGKIDWYRGSGHTIDLPMNLSIAQQTFSEFREYSFMDEATRVLFIDFQTYNPALNYHLLARYVFEMGSMGGVKPNSFFQTLRIERYRGVQGQAQMVFEILTMIFLGFFIVNECMHIRRFGYRFYFTHFWHWIDAINFCFFLLTIVMRATTITKISITDYVDHYMSLQDIARSFMVEYYSESINAFLLWFKLFKYLQFNDRIMFLFRTLKVATNDLLFFVILFFIFFVGFAHAGFLAFSTDVEMFRSMSISIISIFTSVVSHTDFNELDSSSRIFGPIYFLIFQLTMLLVLINVFLAILNDAYSTVRLQDKHKIMKKPVGFWAYMREVYSYCKYKLIHVADNWGKHIDGIENNNPKSDDSIPAFDGKQENKEKVASEELAKHLKSEAAEAAEMPRLRHVFNTEPVRIMDLSSYSDFSLLIRKWMENNHVIHLSDIELKRLWSHMNKNSMGRIDERELNALRDDLADIDKTKLLLRRIATMDIVKQELTTLRRTVSEMQMVIDQAQLMAPGQFYDQNMKLPGIAITKTNYDNEYTNDKLQGGGLSDKDVAKLHDLESMVMSLSSGMTMLMDQQESFQSIVEAALVQLANKVNTSTNNNTTNTLVNAVSAEDDEDEPPNKWGLKTRK